MTNRNEICKSLSLEYPTINPDDRFAVSLVEPDFKHGPWIAGGAPLQWVRQRSAGDRDIDVFCANPQQYKHVCAILSQFKIKIPYVTRNAKTFTITDSPKKDISNNRSQWKVQVITKNWFDSAQAVIDQFDITVCQIATTGTEWLFGPNTVHDINHSLLRFTDSELRPDSVKRLVKYWTYGYRPAQDLLNQILQDPDIKWQFDPDEDYA